MTLAAIRRAIAAARAPADDVDTGGGLPWSAIYPSSPPPAIAAPAVAPSRFRSAAASTTSPVTLALANPSRTLLVIVNDSTAVLYVKLGPGASSSGYTDQVGAGGTLTLETPDVWQGLVTGIWAAPGGGSAVITEL